MLHLGEADDHCVGVVREGTNQGVSKARDGVEDVGDVDFGGGVGQAVALMIRRLVMAEAEYKKLLGNKNAWGDRGQRDGGTGSQEVTRDIIRSWEGSRRGVGGSYDV